MGDLINRVLARTRPEAEKRSPEQTKSTVEALVNQIAKSLVDYPDRVEVTKLSGDHTTVLELRVAKEDLGKIIGRNGRTAQAIRTLLTAAAFNSDKRTVLEIIE